MQKKLLRKISSIIGTEILGFRYINIGFDNINPAFNDMGLVVEAETQSASYIVKIYDDTVKQLTPFWFGMDRLFGASRVESIPALQSLFSHIAGRTNIQKPEVVGSFAGNDHIPPFVIYEKIDGICPRTESRAEDNFKSSKAIASFLGEYLGRLHASQYDGLGNLTGSYLIEKNNFRHHLSEVIKELSQYGKAAHHKEVQEHLSDILEDIQNMPLPNVSLIMPNIWPSQFLMSNEMDTIAGFIDIETYVKGPIELELILLELWISEASSFKQAYEKHCRLPNLEPVRKVYRFLIYLMHDCPPLGLRSLFQEKAKI